MSYSIRLPVTPRLQRMFDAAQQRAEDRGDGYFGAEHLLEAILDEPESVPARLIDASPGLTALLRQRLADYFDDQAARRGGR